MKNGRVYPAESDPRQANGQVTPYQPEPMSPEYCERLERSMIDSAQLAREFGLWILGADGRWMRDRSKAKRRKR